MWVWHVSKFDGLMFYSDRVQHSQGDQGFSGVASQVSLLVLVFTKASDGSFCLSLIY